MNAKLNLIFARRSVRRYRGEAIPESLLRDLLEAAMAAPSACCKDPWHFVVVRERAVLKAIAAGLPNGKMLADAAAGVVVCGDIGQAHDGQLSYLLQDCAAAVQNLLLAAAAVGLGACWLGVHPREDRILHLRRLLALPDAVIPIAMTALGWPADAAPPARTRYRDAAVHQERW